jgi:hypothetical protein
MAQQTFAGVPAEFTAGEVLSSSDQNLLRNYLIAQIKEGMTGDTGEVLPMIMDLTNNRIVLDAGGLEFSNGSLQTVAASAVGFSGTTANGMLTYSSASTIATQSTATYASNTLTLTGAGGGVKLNDLDSSDSNTLDFYEEGTSTGLVLASSSGSMTLSAANDTLAYVRIGRLVFVQGTLELTSVSSPVGTLRVGGLPFTIASDVAEQGDRGGINTFVILMATAATRGLYMHNVQGQTYYDINDGDGATDLSALLANQVDGGTRIVVSGSYYAAA